MEKLFLLRRLTDKGKLKPALYPTGEQVAPWRAFKTEKEALSFAEEYEINNFMIIAKYVQEPDSNTYRFD